VTLLGRLFQTSFSNRKGTTSDRRPTELIELRFYVPDRRKNETSICSVDADVSLCRCGMTATHAKDGAVP